VVYTLGSYKAFTPLILISSLITIILINWCFGLATRLVHARTHTHTHTEYGNNPRTLYFLFCFMRLIQPQKFC